jgi:hypothetical protein
MNNVYTGPGGQGAIAPEVVAASKHRMEVNELRGTIARLSNRIWAAIDYIKEQWPDKFPRHDTAQKSALLNILDEEGTNAKG